MKSSYYFLDDKNVNKAAAPSFPSSFLLLCLDMCRCELCIYHALVLRHRAGDEKRPLKGHHRSICRLVRIFPMQVL